MTRVMGRRRVCLGSASALGATVLVPLTLAGCGFQPVYMPTASNKPGVAQRDLSNVFVEIIPERPGQLLRQALQERFGDDSGTPASYNLRVSFGIAGEGIAVDPANIATRVRFIGTASWTLLGHDDKRSALTAGSARAVDGLNVFDSQYFASDLETETEQKRIAENIATQIATQLAVWFRRRAAQRVEAGS